MSKQTLDDAPAPYARRVRAVLPSLYFAPVGEVLITECGHRHVRPAGYRKVGDTLHCPFCRDDAEHQESVP